MNVGVKLNAASAIYFSFTFILLKDVQKSFVAPPKSSMHSNPLDGVGVTESSPSAAAAIHAHVKSTNHPSHLRTSRCYHEQTRCQLSDFLASNLLLAASAASHFSCQDTGI